MAAKKDKDLNSLIAKEEGIYNFVKRSVLEQGAYVNNHRHMPYLLDGLKPSYRRIIWTTMEEPDKLTKVATLAGICGGKYSPHTPDALPAVVSELVHMKVFLGQGSHGSRSIYKPWSNKPAASRYIEARLNKGWRNMLSKLLPLVEYKDSELDSRYKEPLYIPSPIPLAMTFNVLGLGIGLRSTTPNFSIKSMIEAYLADDYNLLKPNGDLELDKASELKNLWEIGKGNVIYKFHIEDHVYEKINGYILFGDSRFIQISKLSPKFNNKRIKSTKKSNSAGAQEELGWIDSGKVLMIDRSDRKGNKKIFFAVNPKYRKHDKVGDDELKAELEIVRMMSNTYDLNVTDGMMSKRWPLKDWIKKTYTNFDRLVKLYKLRELEKLAIKKLVIKYSKEIAGIVIKTPTIKKEKIAKDLSIDVSLVESVLRKSISVLLKTNEEAEIGAIKKSEKEIKILTTENLYENIING